jgi:hypothetical protein
MTFNLEPSSFGMAISGFSTLPSVALVIASPRALQPAPRPPARPTLAPGTRRLARQNAACGAENNGWNPECSVRGHRLQCPLDVDSGRPFSRKHRPFIDGGANRSIRPSALQDRRDERVLRGRRPTSAGGDMRVGWPATPNSQRNPHLSGGCPRPTLCASAAFQRSDRSRWGSPTARSPRLR